MSQILSALCYRGLSRFKLGTTVQIAGSVLIILCAADQPPFKEFILPGILGAVSQKDGSRLLDLRLRPFNRSTAGEVMNFREHLTCANTVSQTRPNPDDTIGNRRRDRPHMLSM